jgi:hypothetical protein
MPLVLMLFVLPATACLGLSQGEIFGGAGNSGSQLQTSDAATQAALETEIAAGDHEPVLDVLDYALTSYSCNPHPDSTGYDCTYDLVYTVAYESADRTYMQCFFSNAESELLNIAPGAATLEVPLTLGPILVFPPGTSFSGFCDLTDQATGEWLARGGDNVSGWIEVPVP